MTAPRLAIFDLDGTITRGDTFLAFLIATLARSPGRWWRTPALALAVALFAARRRDNAWLKAFFLRQIVGGRPVGVVAAHAARHVEAVLRSHLLDGALAEIARMRRLGARLVLASASPDLYVEALGRRLGFDEIVCTRVARAPNGRVVGHLQGRNCHGIEKRRRVEAYLAQAGVGWGEVAFYSDCHSDLPLLEAAGERYAVNPTPRLARAAAAARIPVLSWREPASAG